METKNKNPPGRFCSGVTIIHSIGSCPAGSRYHLTINLVCTHFYGPSDYGGLAA